MENDSLSTNHVLKLDAVREGMPEGAFDLFCAFSRFEYALKAGEYCGRGRYGEAKADWDKLARKLGDNFFKDVQAEGLAPVLRNRPPKRQVAVTYDDALGPEWQETGPPSSVKELLEAARRVRNNLFHGGKHGTPDEGRDADLIADAMTVLAKVLAVDGDLDFLFHYREGV